MASKKLFGGVRMQLVGAIVATVGSIAMTACSSCCGCGAGPAVYKKPCCAQSGGAQSCGTKSCGAAPAPAPAPKPAGQMACGTGKCG